MNDDNHGQFLSFLSGLLLGAAIGSVAAILLAPQSGRKTRRNLGRAAVGTRKRIGKVAVDIRKGTGDRLDDLADELKERVDDVVAGARRRLTAD